MIIIKKILGNYGKSVYICITLNQSFYSYYFFLGTFVVITKCFFYEQKNARQHG